MLGRYRESVRAWSDPVGLALFQLRLRPNHLTLMGLGVSLLATAAFIAGHVRGAGVLLILAGLFDLLDGSLARASGQVTPFGAFLDSVIDRYSDLVVLLGIVVLFASSRQPRAALVAMAGLVGSVMVSYTKARAESIGVACNVGVMERPERMICVIAGALLDLLEPAMWVLAGLANLTAVQRIVYTRRATRGAGIFPALLVLALAAGAVPVAAEPVGAEDEARWARAIADAQQGDVGPLIRELGAETALASPVGDYAGFLVASAHARRGDVAAARAAALAVADRHPRSRLAPEALLLAARLASLAGDEAAAQEAVKRLIATYPDAREVPAALYLLGMSGEARGQAEPAAHAYRRLVLTAPATAYADGAADRLALLASAGIVLPPPTPLERVERAERLLRGGVPSAALEEAERLASEARDALGLRALRVAADAAQRLRRHEDAARALERAAALAPPAQRARWQLDHARALVRLDQRDRALAVLSGVASTGGEAEAAEALYERARLLERDQRAADAAAAYQAVAARHPTREVAGAAQWRLGWIAYLAGDPGAAEQRWRRLVEMPGGRAYRVAALYWTGRAVEQARGRAAAEAAYRQVLGEAPRSYYGVLAAQRTSGLPEVAAPAVLRLPANPVDAVADDPGFVRVELLRRLGLAEYAWQELEDLVQRAAGDPPRLYGFSAAYARDERHHVALGILRRHFAAVAATGDASLPAAFWQMLYPLAWRGDLTDVAQRANVDPFLVAAVVREESNYHPRAVSRAGARGLMQLMPGTAQPLARHRGLPFAGGALLDDPRANLELGTSFLAGLLRDLGDPRLALAAYNAGPGRLKQWWQSRRTSDLEAFVEQIPFDETRQYVKRVMASWDEYRRIYGQ
jgi:soluble lytic murein transglycosylase